MRLFLTIILLFVLPNFTADSSPKPQLWFLTISVNEGDEDKDNYTKEAELVRDHLIARMPYAVHEKSVLGKECSRENCLKAFDWLNQRCPGDIGVIYIGCHGTKKSKGYAFFTKDDRIYASEMKERLNRTPLLLIVDTCKSGAIVEDWDELGVSIICSCGKDKKAHCWQLAAAITERDFVDLNEMKGYIDERVPQLYWEQHPIFSKHSISLKFKEK